MLLQLAAGLDGQPVVSPQQVAVVVLPGGLLAVLRLQEAVQARRDVRRGYAARHLQGAVGAARPPQGVVVVVVPLPGAEVSALLPLGAAVVALHQVLPGAARQPREVAAGPDVRLLVVAEVPDALQPGAVVQLEVLVDEVERARLEVAVPGAGELPLVPEGPQLVVAGVEGAPRLHGAGRALPQALPAQFRKAPAPASH